MGGTVRRDRAEIRVLPRFNICGPRRRIAEADCTRITAHYRIGFIDVRQAEGMAELVCGNLEEHPASISPATCFGRGKGDLHWQADSTMHVAVDVGFTHLTFDARGIGESNHDVSGSLTSGPAKGRAPK